MEHNQTAEPHSPLQMELDLLRSDYKKLLNELYQNKGLLISQSDSIESLKISIASLIQSISVLTQTNEELRGKHSQVDKKLADKDNIISTQNRKIHEQYQQTDTLNATLSEIYASEGWKLLNVYYRFRDRLLPRESRRHQAVKKSINWIRRKKNDHTVIGDHSSPHGGRNRYERSTPTEFIPFEFPYFSHPQVSIVIPAYNGWEMNYLCLRSIWENTESLSYEIIFADDVSTDETRNIGQYIGNIVHIRNEQNLGFLKNCNHAASLARGEYIHFLNNDTEVTADWLSSLVTLMEKDKTIGMAGSKLIYPDGRLQEAGGIIWQDASGWNYGHKQDPEAPEFNYVKEVDYISGASIMVRKCIWEQLGGFNEMYSPAYCEDSDLAFAIRKEGYKVVYQPLSKVVHFEGFSHGTDDNSKNGLTTIKSYQKINSAKFAEKWQTVLQQQFPNGVNPYWTRDRSHGKPTILVIDHYVPQFDRDAGSRTTFQYLELFVELGLNVKFIGDNFYRHEPYTTILQQKGIEVLYGAHYAENWLTWLTDNEPYIDFILLNRPHISIKYIDIIKSKMHAKIFYYTHDLHFFRDLMEFEVTKDPKRLKSSNEWRLTEYALFTKSDVVLTPSNKEKATIQTDFPEKSIQVMPAFFYPSISDPIHNFNHRKDILFVGGFTHSPNIDGVIWFATEVLPLIRQNNADIRLVVIGSNTPQAILQLASPAIIIKGFVTDEELEQAYQSVRFSIIPLRFGAGLKGKTVEALSKALPIVSTSFGIEGLPDIGSIAQPKDTAAAFAEAVTTLYGDMGKLEELSAAISNYSRQHFTKEAAASFFTNLFTLQTANQSEAIR
jgi:O-antigen biosynthesis protein